MSDFETCAAQCQWKQRGHWKQNLTDVFFLLQSVLCRTVFLFSWASPKVIFQGFIVELVSHGNITTHWKALQKYFGLEPSQKDHIHFEDNILWCCLFPREACLLETAELFITKFYFYFFYCKAEAKATSDPKTADLKLHFTGSKFTHTSGLT